ncbi:hypothetical protein [Streptomyces sp. SM1]|uniref:hypothetical protein n=1 Tax=Streptomyces sp. SM1 TaxID=402229 RepID=UPI001CA51173|nr:hypothetical protein [Streptomyces sp. SM1]
MWPDASTAPISPAHQRTAAAVPASGLDEALSFSGCSFGGPSSATLELDHVRDFLPDVSHGTRSNSCNTVSWGEVGKAEFYFIYIGSTRLSVNSVVTRY